MEKNVTALLVHNVAEALYGLHVQLENQAVRTCRARTCQEVAQSVAGPRSPHLIFTDTELPDGTWADVVHIAASSETPIGVVVVSRFVDIKAYIEAIECGAFDFIVPPVAAADLDHVLRCAVWNVMNRREAFAHAA